MSAGQVITVQGESYRWLRAEAFLGSSSVAPMALRLFSWLQSDRLGTVDPMDVHWLRTIASERGTLRSAWAGTLLQEFQQPTRRGAVA
jgi:hypothetical protein